MRKDWNAIIKHLAGLSGDLMNQRQHLMTILINLASLSQDFMAIFNPLDGLARILKDHFHPLDGRFLPCNGHAPTFGDPSHGLEALSRSRDRPPHILNTLPRRFPTKAPRHQGKIHREVREAREKRFSPRRTQRIRREGQGQRIILNVECASTASLPSPSCLCVSVVRFPFLCVLGPYIFVPIFPVVPSVPLW